MNAFDQIDIFILNLLHHPILASLIKEKQKQDKNKSECRESVIGLTCHRVIRLNHESTDE